MERLQIDLKEYELYRDENDGYRQILSVIDHFSNFAWAFPLKSKKASETAYHLYRLFCDWGAPKVLQSDNGGEFVNNTLAGLAKEWNFTLVTGITILESKVRSNT
jgi:hypothetical protein